MLRQYLFHQTVHNQGNNPEICQYKQSAFSGRTI